MSSVNNRFTALVDHLSVDILETMDKFEGLKDEWNGLFKSCGNLSVWQSFTWNYIWWNNFGHSMQLSIFAVRENDRLVGIGPFMINPRLGIPELEPIGGEHHYNFALIMESRRDDVAGAIAMKLAERYPGGLIHIPYFAAGESSNGILTAALHALGWKESRWTRNISHYVSENDGFHHFISHKSKKSVYNLKRERSRLNEAGPVALNHISNSALTEDVMQRVAALQKQSWLTRRGQESLNEPFYRELVPALAKEDHAEIHLYEQSGRDIAYVLNFYSGDTGYCMFIGFDETKAHLSPGKILMMDNLQKVLDSGITVYDFLYGEGEYKRFWANRTKYICRATYHKGFRGYLLSWFPHRLHGVFSKYKFLKTILIKMRIFKTQMSVLSKSILQNDKTSSR